MKGCLTGLGGSAEKLLFVELRSKLLEVVLEVRRAEHHALRHFERAGSQGVRTVHSLVERLHCPIPHSRIGCRSSWREVDLDTLLACRARVEFQFSITRTGEEISSDIVAAAAAQISILESQQVSSDKAHCPQLMRSFGADFGGRIFHAIDSSVVSVVRSMANSIKFTRST